MFRWILLALGLSLLAPWPAAATGGALSNPDTGVSGVYSAQGLISHHPHHVLVGHVIVVTRGGETVRALVIHQRRDGVHRLRFREAWMQGIELPFQSFARRGLGCTHGHCRDNQVGMIFLSTALFDRALRDGLSARLVGPSGALQVEAPPALFEDARVRAVAHGLTTAR